jgi:hypothetical protein
MNTYGIHIGSLTAGVQTNAAFGIYQSGTERNVFGGICSIGTISNLGQLGIVNATAANKALVVRGAASQTGDLADFQNSAGTSLTRVMSDGMIRIGSSGFVGSFSAPAIQFGGSGSGIYTDSNRVFFSVAGNYIGGFDSSGYIGNSLWMNGVLSNNSVDVAKLGGYRLTANGLLCGISGNSSGDAGLVTNSVSRVTAMFAGNVGIGTNAPSASAQLEVSSTTRGFLPPRMTTTERNAIATPVAGLVIFNTTTTKLECYDGSVWQAAW